MIFCPYCGARTIDEGPQRTYCTTCGEDVTTPGQVEDLEDELAREKDDYADLEKNLKEAEEKVKDLTKRIESQFEDLEKQDKLLGDCKVALEQCAGYIEEVSSKTMGDDFTSPLLEQITEVRRRLP